MNKKIIIAILSSCAAVACTIAGFLILPSTLVTQISITGGAGSTMPNWLILPATLLINIVFSWLYATKEEKSRSYLFISIISLGLFAALFAANL